MGCNAGGYGKPATVLHIAAGYLAVLVAFMSAFTAGGRRAFRVVSEVVGVVLLPATNLLLRYALLSCRLFVRTRGVFVLRSHVPNSCWKLDKRRMSISGSVPRTSVSQNE